MKLQTQTLILTFMVMVATSCNTKKTSDAYGNFEAIETTISAEANGRILMLNLEEGSILMQGDTVGLIDTTDLHLKRVQMMAQRSAIGSKHGNLDAQAQVYEQQKRNLEKDRDRKSTRLNSSH